MCPKIEVRRCLNHDLRDLAIFGIAGVGVTAVERIQFRRLNGQVAEGQCYGMHSKDMHFPDSLCGIVGFASISWEFGAADRGSWSEPIFRGSCFVGICHSGPQLVPFPLLILAAVEQSRSMVLLPGTSEEWAAMFVSPVAHR